MVVGEVPLPLCQGDHTRLDLISWDRKRRSQIDRWSGTLAVLICDIVGQCPKELFFFLREPYIREAIQEENGFYTYFVRRGGRGKPYILIYFFLCDYIWTFFNGGQGEGGGGGRVKALWTKSKQKGLLLFGHCRNRLDPRPPPLFSWTPKRDFF